MAIQTESGAAAGDVLPGTVPSSNAKARQDFIGQMNAELGEIELLRMKGEYDKMIEMFRRMREKIVIVGGETHPDVAAILGG